MVRLLVCLTAIFTLLAVLATAGHTQLQPPQMQRRWLFVWRNMANPAEVDRTIALLPRAQAAGYNDIAFSANIPAGKVA